MNSTITGRTFSVIKNEEVRRSMVLREERDIQYDLEHEEVERSYEKVIFDGKSIHGMKL